MEPTPKCPHTEPVGGKIFECLKPPHKEEHGHYMRAKDELAARREARK